MSKIIYLRIPKTANTILYILFEKIYGREYLYDCVDW